MPKNQRLTTLRNKIDHVDRQVVALLDKRVAVTKNIAIEKEKLALPFTDAKRERQLLKQLHKSAKNKFLRQELPAIYQPVLKISKRVRLEQSRYNPTTRIGIIGYGRFGKLLTKTLQVHWPKAKLKVSSQGESIDRQLFFPLPEVAKTNLLLLCVPISAMTTVLKKIKPLLAPTTAVIDVCSVKVKPVQWMKEILGKQPMIASHPMFGPESTRNGTEFLGLNMMLCNISASQKTYRLYKDFWKHLGVRIVEMTPEQHDRYAAYTINYNHLIGRLGEAIGIRPTPIDTKGFSVIYEALEYVLHDSWQLFSDMQNFNPYAKDMRQKVRQALNVLEKKLHQKSV